MVEELETRLTETHRKGLPDEEEHLVGDTRAGSAEDDSASAQVTEETAPMVTDTRTEEEGTQQRESEDTRTLQPTDINTPPCTQSKYQRIWWLRPFLDKSVWLYQSHLILI